jgi:hypothetical protein
MKLIHATICHFLKAATLLLYSWVFVKIYNWFIAPVYTLPVTQPLVFGVIMLFCVFYYITKVPRLKDDVDDEPKDVYYYTFWHMIAPLSLLLLSFICKLWFAL